MPLAFVAGSTLKYPSIKVAIYNVSNAWSRVSEETIMHCWNHVDIIFYNDQNDDHNISNNNS